ncbi:hypothetical protein HNQ91_002577 [Filimonas zeae]|uniref:Uncharacterized protein n=1 Tax=Filimonas zeae TaxID=1737353 RepID=A0A917MTD7_9BACT|nr:hypothetical protein [Filimonas zeae]MDR6339526.1 hypothetical protein [Filimonas zeae]GGH63210.1 hypothetical protein GCM10011379_13850 [Filimonas zeae]
MKQLSLLLLPLLLFTTSCLKSGNKIKTEDITTGEKWGIQIGSSPAEVYGQLQELDEEKNVSGVEVINMPLFDNPASVGPSITLYQIISLEEQDAAYPNRVLIAFNDNKVKVAAGTAMPDSVSRWPQNAADDKAIIYGEAISTFYDKLMDVHASGVLNNYKIRLGAKALATAYDPRMATYTRWRISFFHDGILSTADLYFKSGALERIYHEYTEM